MAPKFTLCLLILLTGCFVAGKNSDFRQISYHDLQSSIDQYVERPSGTFTYAQFLHDAYSNELLVGAKDALYRFELRSLRLLEKAIWEAPANKTAFCIVKGQTEQDCHNYIKVLLISDRKLFACGTNAFSPQCSWRRLDRLSDVSDWVDGIAKCPYNPAANITALISDEGEYYIGGPTDFAGSDAAVYRTNIGGKHGKQVAALRTNQYNSKWLDNPQFVGSFETNHFVYTIFRENAIEFSNCGKVVYSRVARVCKNDIGGQLIHKDNWSTFVKARLNCSMPGEYPFYFDEIQSIYYIKKENILYATFSTPTNSITGSAVCAFNLSAINDAFQGPFYHQDTPSSPWQPYKPQHQHHSECRMTQSRGTQFLDGAKYQLMHNAVQPVSTTPLHNIKLQRYTHIVVEVIDTKHYKNVHVIFVATDKGVVKKITVLPRTQETCVVETWNLAPAENPVRVTGMFTIKDTRSVYVSTDGGLIRIDTEHCRRHVSRSSCLNSMDPYCGWNERQEACTTAPDDNPLARFWQQSFTSCPILNTPVDGGWSTWSDWSSCSLKPGNDSNPSDKCLCRSRQCNNPSAQNGGRTCVGATIQVTNCTVHGGWTAWSAWSECSASCGPAYRSRFRTCGNPSPAHGGRVCVGQDSQQVLCMQNPPCSEPATRSTRDGSWSSWSPWEQCTASCGGGYRVRRRRCDSSSSQEGGVDCPGNSVEYELCNTHDCPTVKKYGPWSQWLVANASGMNTSYDGFVVEKRFRCSCNAPAAHPTQVRVAIAKEEERYCRSDGTCNAANSQQRWSSWSPWSECSAKCGGGYQSRSRTCLGKPDECIGPAFMSRSCNHHGCYGKWSCWSEWTACSVTCGVGSQTRTRVCLARDKDGEDDGCNGASSQERSCEMQTCAALEAATLSGSAISTGVVLAYCLAGFIVGLAFACFVFFFYTRSKRTEIPSSPHYLPSKQNPYITIPLQDAPTKRPSYSSTSNRDRDRNSRGFIMNNTGTGTLRHHKNEYDSATVKRNSHHTMNNVHNRTDGADIPDKYY